MHYIYATQQRDERSPDDERTQPWLVWWPRRNEVVAADQRKNNESFSEWQAGPWDTWTFDPENRFDKPWLSWPMKWPPTYNNSKTAPLVEFDHTFVTSQLARRWSFPFSSSVFTADTYRTTTQLQFFEANGVHGKPYVSKVPLPAPMPQINFGGRYEKVMVTDVRGREQHFTLDDAGFEFVRCVSKVQIIGFKLLDIPAYMNEMAAWLQEYVGGEEVFIFDTALRTEGSKGPGWGDVARRVHCDQSPRSARGRIQLHMGERASELLQKRCRFINLWRPLIEKVEAFPLAICPYGLVSNNDLVPVDIVYPHYAEESFEIRHSDRQQWFFRSGATFEDVTLLKVYDSDRTAACYAPHSGFKDSRATSSGGPRMSLELRFMVFGGSTKDDVLVLDRANL